MARTRRRPIVAPPQLTAVQEWALREAAEFCWRNPGVWVKPRDVWFQKNTRAAGHRRALSGLIQSGDAAPFAERHLEVDRSASAVRSPELPTVRRDMWYVDVRDAAGRYVTSADVIRLVVQSDRGRPTTGEVGWRSPDEGDHWRVALVGSETALLLMLAAMKGAGNLPVLADCLEEIDPGLYGEAAAALRNPGLETIPF